MSGEERTNTVRHQIHHKACIPCDTAFEVWVEMRRTLVYIVDQGYEPDSINDDITALLDRMHGLEWDLDGDGSSEVLMPIADILNDVG